MFSGVKLSIRSFVLFIIDFSSEQDIISKPDLKRGVPQKPNDMTRTDIKEDICHLDFVFVCRSMYKMNYCTDIIVNFLGGAYWRGALISKVLLFGGALIGEGHLLESGRLLDQLR